MVVFPASLAVLILESTAAFSVRNAPAASAAHHVWSAVYRDTTRCNTSAGSAPGGACAHQKWALATAGFFICFWNVWISGPRAALARGISLAASLPACLTTRPREEIGVNPRPTARATADFDSRSTSTTCPSFCAPGVIAKCWMLAVIRDGLVGIGTVRPLHV